MVKVPTNTDIVKLVTLQHQEVKDRLSAVEDQVKYTNGQVRVLNQWKSNQEAVEAYKASQPQTTVKVTNNSKEIDWTKLTLALLGVLGTAMGIIASMAAGGTFR